MIKLKTLFICIGLISCTSFLSAQTASDVSEQKHITETSKMYSYRFTGKISPSEIEQLKKDVLNMEFVKEVKVEYKTEKSGGQLRLITIEKFTNTDKPFQFDILGLKELLISKNLFPEEYNSVLISEK